MSAPKPDWLDRLAAMRDALPRDGVFAIEVRHDDHCDFLNGRGDCNCEPEIAPPERVQ